MPRQDHLPTVTVDVFRRGTASVPVPPISLAADDCTARPASRQSGALLLLLLLLVSITAHAALLAMLYGAPRPLQGVNVPAISVEIVVGDNTAAGLASAVRKEATAEVKPSEAMQARPTIVESEPVEAPAVAEATLASVPDRPQEVMAPAQAAMTPPKPRSQSAPETVPPERPQHRPERPEAKEIPEVSKRRQTAALPAAAAGGMGRGGSTASSIRYAGRFAAHLARHKRYPPGARRRGHRGSAGVDVSIDGQGRVIAVRIVRSSGFARLDRAAEAMVRRASPFPPPPGRRPLRLRVPITYR